MIYLYLDKISFVVQGENTSSTAYGPLTSKLIGKQVLLYIPMTTTAVSKQNGKESSDTSLPCDMWLVSEGDDCLKSSQMINKDILSIELPEKIWINKWSVEQGLAVLQMNFEENNITSISKPFFEQQMKVLKDAETFAKTHDMGIWGFKNQQIKLQKERERIQRWRFRTGKRVDNPSVAHVAKDPFPKEGSLFRDVDKKHIADVNFH